MGAIDDADSPPPPRPCRQAVTASPHSAQQSLTGWGRTAATTAQLCQPSSLEQIQALIHAAGPAGLIPRGLGRAYGNPAQCEGGTVLDLAAFDQISLDSAHAWVTAGAGVSLDALLRAVVPAGFFLPVTPGTRNVTVGGAIAADVHGKNHHGEGSFANHVIRLQLVDGQGQLRELSPSDPSSAAAFWATAGGMGLTGVITEVTFRLIPIETSLISVDTDRFGDLNGLMAAMVEADARYRQGVACVGTLVLRGIGLITCGDQALQSSFVAVWARIPSLTTRLPWQGHRHSCRVGC